MAAMSSVGVLSSYFTRRHRDPKAFEEVDTSVRARLERKLQVKQKAKFAFDFAVEGDADGLQNGGRFCSGDPGERGSLRSGFNPTDTNGVGADAPRASKGKGTGDRGSLRAAQDFVVEVEDRRAQPTRKNKSKKKTSGKKKKGAKRKGKAAEDSSRGLERDQQPQQDANPNEEDPASAVGKDRDQTTQSLPPTASDSSLQNELREPDPAKPDSGDDNIIPRELRPPPGFTLESWKDPALSAEERRRRRFGNGVRNLVAIQRSCDARRGSVAAGVSDAADFRARHGGLVRPDRDKGREGSGQVLGHNTGERSSVFSFGFDIGISFNCGSQVLT